MDMSKSRPGSEKVPQSPSKVIAAIDFGTTCTGYAYYIQKQGRPQLDLQGINIQQSWDGTADIGLQAPTSLLLKPDKKFDKFGFEAETEYATLALRKDHINRYFFRHFKMTLHHQEDIHTWMELEDVHGKRMNACEVFMFAIKYVKDHLYKKIREGSGDAVSDSDVQWVLTVPAIWRDSAKQFMRTSAEKAGIPSEQLTLALEPESAAIFCKELALNRAGGMDGVVLKSLNPGEKFLVLDLGGGTVDTTVHDVQKDGRLKELHAATGGPWGGENVNKAFENLIKTLVTDEVFHAYKKQHTRDWLEVQDQFENKKRKFTEKTGDTDIPNFTLGLEDVYKEATKRDLEVRDGKIGKYEAKIQGRALLLPPKTMNKLFQEAIKPINDHISALLHKPNLRGVKSILLVGGFAESSIVKESVKKCFNNLRVFAPPKASAAILQGAVLYGLNPNVIAIRLSPFTYGVRTRKPFDPKVHPQERMTEPIKGQKIVINAFSKHIEIGQSMYINESSHEQTYTMKKLKNRSIYMAVFQSVDPNPLFCDERGCKQIGRVSFRIPDTVPWNNIKFRLSMTCQGTELVAKAKVSGCAEEFKANFDFLSTTDQFLSDEDTTEMC